MQSFSIQNLSIFRAARPCSDQQYFPNKLRKRKQLSKEWLPAHIKISLDFRVKNYPRPKCQKRCMTRMNQKTAVVNYCQIVHEREEQWRRRKQFQKSITRLNFGKPRLRTLLIQQLNIKAAVFSLQKKEKQKLAPFYKLVKSFVRTCTTRLEKQNSEDCLRFNAFGSIFFLFACNAKTTFFFL